MLDTENYVATRPAPPVGLFAARLDPRNRSLRAAALSFLLPGLGQLFLRRTRRGALFLIVAAVAAAGVGWLASLGTVPLLRLLLRPGALETLLAANVALLTLRAGAVVDAYLLGRPRRRRGRLRTVASAAGLALLMGLTALPHAAAAHYQREFTAVLGEVFAPVAGAPDLGAPPTYPEAPPAASPEPEEPAEPVEPEPPPPPPGPWDGRERVTILLVGSDAGAGRSGHRTDAMMVASIEVATGRVAIVGVPRNLIHVPLPEGWPFPDFPRPLNALYESAYDHGMYPEAADPGAVALVGAVAELIGVPIDHYAMLDMRGFVEVVDAFGGVTVQVIEPLHDSVLSPYRGGGSISIDLAPGWHHLAGEEALAYVRIRRGGSDYTRMLRQRCMLGSLAGEADPLAILRALPKLLPAVKDNVRTDLPIDKLPDLVELLERVESGQVAVLGLVPPTFTGGRTAGGYPLPDVPKIHETVALLLAPTPGRDPGSPQVDDPDAPEPVRFPDLPPGTSFDDACG